MATLLETAVSDILKHISDALVLLDLDGRILFHNDAFAAMVGRGGEDLRGVAWSPFAGLAISDRADAAAVERADARPALFSIDIPARDGTSREYCVKREPFTDQAGRVTGIFQSFRPMDCGRTASLDVRVANRIGERGNETVRGEDSELRRALEANRWNASRTARALGISRTTLWRRMRRSGLLPRVQPT